ncbi:M56 family metallopeptidase [Lachnoclostridium phytofermentans]|uniref:Penicillin binding protein n=1 Tax=Lachnoclostridium phytofermentans (strain ATCC 700394 / DSM 18823 / ISDg) TaxID=357809 RepID=A9KKV2_LACP7|nr:penicillin binding protein [Lachnoclostridium phytofermentans ISDg]
MWGYTLFPKIVDMSLTASVVIVFVLLARLLLKKAPKKFSYFLWIVVLFRLICPVSISTSFSLFNVIHAPATT